MARAAQSLSPQQRQHLALTPGLKQSLQVLQMNGQEVVAFVEKKLEENPLLERDTQSSAGQANAGPGEAWWEALEDRAPSLQSYLIEQARLHFNKASDRTFVESLILSLSEAGYLERPLAELAKEAGLTADRALVLLKEFQRLAPTGVGARDLGESLLLQLAERAEVDAAWQILLSHLPLIAAGKQRELQELTGLKADELARRLATLRQLDPKPGLSFDPPKVEAIIPDLLLRKEDGHFRVEINPLVAPRLRLDPGYRTALGSKARKGEVRGYLKGRRQEALWLVNALKQREATLLAVGEELIERQKDFLEKGPLALKPLNLKTVAEALGLSESTLSRVTAKKYLGRAEGSLPLRAFFSVGLGESGRAASATRWRLAQLLKEPPAGGGWSDAALAKKLAEEGFPVARRTVAKYRQSLGFSARP